jgi:pimeloyl-ACP methyl ester carboxylesterase
MNIDVDGCRVHLRTWGDAELPPLVLVHCAGAHSGWWDHIAPFFARTHRVIAPDLSGHGDSGRRSEYSVRAWAQEVIAVAGSPGTDAAPRPTVVGHSLGGRVAAAAAEEHGHRLDSIVVVDLPLSSLAPVPAMLHEGVDRNSLRTKPELLTTFLDMSLQETNLPYIGHHIASESVHKSLGRSTWKLDPATLRYHRDEPILTGVDMLEDLAAEIPCRLGYLRCAAGMVPDSMAASIRKILQLRGPFVELAEASHYPMLDQPLPLVAALRTLLEMWSIS